jgi:quercetin dioxygenase-like cupin family protein
MVQRDSHLQNLLDHVETSITCNQAATPPMSRLANKIFSSLRARTSEPMMPNPKRLPPCAFIGDAVTEASRTPGKAADIVLAFKDIEQRLTWARRKGWENEDETFAHGHANATIIGPGGLEPRDDVWIGVSLMAPNVCYPDHQHPPEEVYTVLSDGVWRHGDGEWFSPGIGGLVHNPPGIVHAMRAGEKPLLAIWCLWIG